METTTNYKLPQWVKADQIKMDDFNGAFANIDAALKANADAAGGKAEASTVAAIAQDIGSGGQNCRAVLGSYIGTGTHGEENKITLQAPFKPLMVLITNPSTSADNGLLLWLHGMETGDNGYNGKHVTLEWGENSVSWYFTTTSSVSSPEALQLNSSNRTYHYTILGR